MLDIYKNKKVFITGNTGFKGSWLSTLFENLNIQIVGFALPPQTSPNHFTLLGADYETTFGNILDKQALESAIKKAQPDIIFHLAAQALVSESYEDPVNTYQTNVIGTLNVLECVRTCESVASVVIITTDKVYENKEWEKPYLETDELGGYDMYSSSKACCEILIKSYRNSFFNLNEYKQRHTVLIASARAGNVIGGGDWNPGRLIPDISVAAAQNKKVQIRNPTSVRPWQHVLDCLYGYLLLGARLLNGEKDFSEAWNFSPPGNEAKTVKQIAAIAKDSWKNVIVEFAKPGSTFHEAKLLSLDSTKAIKNLGWRPVWDTTKSVRRTIEWYKLYYNEGKILTGNNIEEYLHDVRL